jgi:hypothetical protein
MTEASQSPIPRFHSSQYGVVEFEGGQIPCAFGGEPGRFTALIMVQGVCQTIGIPLEGEIERIQGHHLIQDGLFLVPFQFMDQDGKLTTRHVPAITLTRLHTWLAMIPPEIVEDEDMRRKLVATQKELTDVIYAYFGRRLLPQEIRAEDDPYIDETRRQIYEKIEEASQLGDRVTHIEGSVEDLKKQVGRLMITISAGEAGDHISADQQEQLKAMIDILARRYEEKHGKGTRGALINGLKERHNWRFFNSVPKGSWASLVQDCIHIFRQLNPKGTPLPRVFELAQQSISQNSLF